MAHTTEVLTSKINGPKDTAKTVTTISPNRISRVTENDLQRILPSSETMKQMSGLMTKPTKWHMRPVKTQISPGIRRLDWSESSRSAWWKLGSLATHWAQSEDSDQTGQMPSLSLCWTHSHFVGFVKRWLKSEQYYRKKLNNSDTNRNCSIYPKHTVMYSKDADGMAINVDSYQIAISLYTNCPDLSVLIYI